MVLLSSLTPEVSECVGLILRVCVSSEGKEHLILPELKRHGGDGCTHLKKKKKIQTQKQNDLFLQREKKIVSN